MFSSEHVFKSSETGLELDKKAASHKTSAGRSGGGKEKKRRNSEPLVRLQQDPDEPCSAAKEPRPWSPGNNGESDDEGEGHAAEYRIDHSHCPMM